MGPTHIYRQKHRHTDTVIIDALRFISMNRKKKKKNLIIIMKRALIEVEIESEKPVWVDKMRAKEAYKIISN